MAKDLRKKNQQKQYVYPEQLYPNGNRKITFCVSFNTMIEWDKRNVNEYLGSRSIIMNDMNKGQKRLAAIFLAIMGVVGTLMAMKDRQAMIDAGVIRVTEHQVEVQETTNP